MKENIYKLKESEEKYKNFPEKSLNPVFRTSKDGILLYANPAFRRLISEEQTKIGYKVPEKWIEMIKKVYNSRKRQQTEVEVSGRVFLFDMVPVIESGYVNFYTTDITKHKNADRAVEEAYEYAESIVDTVREPLIVLDGKLRVVSANKSFYNSFKVTPKETIGHLIYNLGNRQWNIPELRKLLEKILPNNTTFDNYRVEHDFPRIGRRIVLLNARRIPQPPAKPRIILLAIEDITNKKITQEALEETEEKFRQFFENSNDAIFIADPLTRKLIDCNKKAEKLVGRSKAEILSMLADNLHPTDRAKETMEEFKKQIEGKAELVETEVLTKAGKRIYVEVNSSIVQISGKKYMVGIFRNITERKKAEEELIAERNKIKTYLDSLVDGVTITDKNANIIEVNKAYVEMLGYKLPSDIIGKSFTNFIVEKEIPRLSKKFIEIIKNKELLIKDFEVIDKRKDGSELSTMVNMRVLWNEGEYAGCISVIRDITESKRVEQVIKESEEKYNAFFNNASDAITVVSPDTRKFVEVNKAAEKLTGYSKKELFSMTFDLIHPKDKIEEIVTAIRKTLENSDITVLETDILTKDNKKVSVLLSGSNVKIGNKVFLMGIFKDITERKKAEEELKERENRYKTLVENLPQKVFLKDKNSVYLSCNDNYAKDLKIKPEEIVGKTDFEFYTKKLAKKYRADDNRIMKSGKTEDIEERYVQDGQESWVHTIKTPIRDEKGNVVGILGIFWNITEQKKAQEELKVSEARYRSYIEATKQLGWTTDAKGLVIEDMPSWRAYTGQSFEKIKNWGWVKAIHPDDAKHTAEVWEKAVKTKSIYETEYRIRGKDGKYKWFLARGIPVLKEDGSIREWVGTCVDISERIKIEEEIKKARDELQLKVEELEKFNKLTIGRELKMVELKRRIKELEYELGKENKLI